MQAIFGVLMREVADLHGFLLEVGQRNHRHVRNDEQFVVAGHLDDRHVAQHAFRGKQSCFLVENAAHVFVGRDQSLHQHVGIAGNDGRDGLLHALDVAGFIDDVECLDVDVVLGADLLDNAFFAVKRRLYEALLVGFVHRLQRM